jgi:hypothetical protein
MKTIPAALTLLALALWFPGVAITSARAADFQAGVARVNITPPMPFWLSGYASRTNPATVVRHELFAKALALADDRGGRVVIVTADLIGYPREFSDTIAERVAKQYGLARPQLLLNTSHTHYGPVIRSGLSVMFNFDNTEKERVAEYSRKLGDDIVVLVGVALADLAPAQLACGHGTAGFAMNRREKITAGVKLGENPTGPMDHDVPVLRVTAPDGKLRAVLFAYACHGTTLSGKFNEVDSDFGGYAQRALEQAHPGATALYMVLCAGDQNPKPRGEYEHVELHGRELTSAVESVLAGELKVVHPPIRTAHAVAQLDFAEHTRAQFEQEAVGAGLAKPDKFKQRRANLMLAAYDKGQPVRQLPFQVQALRFGADLTLLALSGEVVVDYALRAKREFPGENLTVAGYCNDVSSYIPSLRVLREGGYEPEISMIYYGQPGPFSEKVEEQVFAAIHQVMRQAGAGE